MIDENDGDERQAIKPTPESEQKIEIIIRSPTGKTFTIIVGAVSETVKSLKYRICEREGEFGMHATTTTLMVNFHLVGYPLYQQRLIFNNAEMADADLLSFYEVKAESWVNLVLNT